MGFRPQRTFDYKDYGVDVVAWRDHADGRPGKLLLLGGCATGIDWESKLDELRPDTFFEQWMIETPPSRALKAFFVPFRLGSDRWDIHSRRAGILFDRCRIASVCAQLPVEQRHGDVRSWLAASLSAVRGGRVR